MMAGVGETSSWAKNSVFGLVGGDGELMSLVVESGLYMELRFIMLCLSGVMRGRDVPLVFLLCETQTF